VDVGLEGETCNFSCDPGYMLQGSVTNGNCEVTGSWSDGLPPCEPRNCPANTETLSDGVAITQSPLCTGVYQSLCTLSCVEGFTGNSVTYMCNVTSDPTMVEWVPLSGVDVMCERGLFCKVIFVNINCYC